MLSVGWSTQCLKLCYYFYPSSPKYWDPGMYFMYTLVYSGRSIYQYSEQRRLEINHMYNRQLWPLLLLKV